MRNMRLLLILFIIFILPFQLSAQIPVISSFTPSTGSPGTIVTITGGNFSTTPQGNKVYFGAVQATVISANANTLTVSVPIGTTYRPISVATNNLIAYSNRPFIVSYGSSGTNFTSTAFASATNFSGGGFVTEGDLDADGKVDLVYTSFSNNTITVLRNTSTTGAVSFGSTLIGGVVNPISVKAADLNGDGLLDLIVANPTFNIVYVLKNNSVAGSISFASALSFATGSEPRKIAVADLDGDGKTDIVTANASSNSISVLKNSSTASIISFNSKLDFTGPATPEGVTIGDLDNDGKPDVAVAGYSSASIVSVFKNVSTPGNISLNSKIDYTTGSFPWDVAIADLDGDGKAELLSSNSSPNTVSVFRNTSTSSLSFAPRIDLATSSSPRGLGVSDLDGDGKPDIVTANWFSSSDVCVLKNVSTSGVVSFYPFVSYATNTGPGSIALADLNGDGLTDITSANSNSNSLSYLRNTLNILPQCPQLLTPSNNSLNIDFSAPVVLKWRKEAKATSYKLKITSQNGSNTEVTVTDTVYNFSPGAGENYTWSVTPSNMPDQNFTCTAFNFSTCAALPAGVTIAAGATGKCIGDSIKIIASPSGTGRQWFLNNKLISGATGDSIWAKAAGIYTVKVLNGSCYSNPSNSVTINNVAAPAKPALSVQGATTFCQGDSVILFSSLNLNNQWFNGNSLISGSTGTSYSATQSGSYYVRVTDAGTGCHNYSDTIAAVATPLPNTPTISYTGSLTICSSQNIVLQSSAATGNQWYKDGTAINNATSQQYQASQSGAYTVRATQGCTSLASSAVNVVVNLVPSTPTITTTGNLTFCASDSVRLQSSAVSGNQWYKNNTAISVPNQGFYAKDAGTYTVRVTENNCTSEASPSVVVNVNARPAKPVITNNNTQLTATVGYAGYQWYMNNSPISGASAAQYNFTQNGVYKVEITDNNGCKNVSDDFNVTTTATNEVVWEDFTIKVYPNPVSNQLSIKLTGNMVVSRSVTAELYDITGHLLQTLKLKSGINSINMKGYSSGLYSILLKGRSGQKTIRVTKAN